MTEIQVLLIQLKLDSISGKTLIKINEGHTHDFRQSSCCGLKSSAGFREQSFISILLFKAVITGTILQCIPSSRVPTGLVQRQLTIQLHHGAVT